MILIKSDVLLHLLNSSTWWLMVAHVNYIQINIQKNQMGAESSWLIPLV